MDELEDEQSLDDLIDISVECLKNLNEILKKLAQLLEKELKNK